MDTITIYRELNSIIKLGEEKIREFHKTRKNVDSFSRAVSSFFSNKVCKKCYDELYCVTHEIKRVYIILGDFDRDNKEYFTGAMEKYLKAYKEYLECAKIVSEKRLEIQRLILQIKTGNKSKTASANVISMMNEIDILVNDCKNKALKVNEAARQITDANEI